MKTIKLAIMAVTLGAVSLIAVSADARPHRRVCTTRFVHGHKVHRCVYR